MTVRAEVRKGLLDSLLGDYAIAMSQQNVEGAAAIRDELLELGPALDKVLEPQRARVAVKVRSSLAQNADQRKALLETQRLVGSENGARRARRRKPAAKRK